MPEVSYARPRPLHTGAQVALVAPAGPLRGESDLNRAVENVRSFGWTPVIGENVRARSGYFAGTDEERMCDFNAALRSDSVDALWCVRGGYGAMRLLDGLDYDALCRNPRVVLGYSDITALHCAIGVRCGIVTYHGPTARAEITEFTRAALDRAVVQQRGSCGAAPSARTIREGSARGRLAGGNLSVLSALVGTRYMPDLAGAILVLEDVNEPVYRVDRMMRQLLLAGALTGIVAIAFGHCTRCDEADDDGGAPNGARALADVLGETAAMLAVPCVVGLPIGHVADQWTIPLGALATLDADALTLNTEEG